MKLFRKNDLIIIVCVIILALMLLLPSVMKKDYLTATVYVDGKAKEEIELNDVDMPYTITPKNGTEIEIDKGKIRFSSAVCKDKICINSGWLEKNGQTAACLPERIVISVKGSDKAPDMLTY